MNGLRDRPWVAMLAGLLTLGGTGVVLVTTGEWWLGVPAAVALAVGAALTVLGAFPRRTHGEIHGPGFDLHIDLPQADEARDDRRLSRGDSPSVG